jgi:hypothetical protein
MGVVQRYYLRDSETAELWCFDNLLYMGIEEA